MRRYLIGFAVAALAGMSAMPVVGRAADLVPHVVSAECTGTVTTPGSGTCTQTFELNVPGFASNIDSHGNFHSVFAQAGGVRLTWKDAVGNTVWQGDCLGIGLSAGGVGPLDVQSATCTNHLVSSTYAKGTQTLLVEAATDGCLEGPTCEFHGKISISADGALV